MEVGFAPRALQREAVEAPLAEPVVPAERAVLEQEQEPAPSLRPVAQALGPGQQELQRQGLSAQRVRRRLESESVPAALARAPGVPAEPKRSRSVREQGAEVAVRLERAQQA